MMTSYFHLLRIAASGQPVLHDHSADLPDLVGLPFATLRLKIEDLFDAFLREDVMAPADPLVESQTPQQMAKVVEGDIRIRRASQDTGEKLIVLGHADSSTLTLPCHLVKRSSCAAATISPSRTRHAAESWSQTEMQRMVVMVCSTDRAQIRGDTVFSPTTRSSWR